MEEIFKDQVAPGRWMWCVINNLEQFNNKPDYIITLIDKFHRVKDHHILSSFENIINTIESYYIENGTFPGIEWLKLDFQRIRTIVEDDSPFSMQIYQSLIRYIDQEVLVSKINKQLVEVENPSVETFRSVAEEMIRYSAGEVEEHERTLDELCNMYDNYAAKFDGIKTHIKNIDDVIGVLGYKSLTAFAAPTGHGKSTFAFSVAYYAAMSGRYVDYLSFEVPEEHAWFNFASIESHGTNHPLPSQLMKNKELTKEQCEWFKEHLTNLVKRAEAAGGGISIIDQTEASGINTYEDLCARLELKAEKRGRKADLIIVDNIDNFQTLRSKERDEITKVNNYIINLDGFCKKYHNGDGTTILLLSQVNRGAMGRLYKASNESGKGSAKVDVTCIQKYNALYEKPTCVLIGFADESARSSGIMRIYPAKLRNGPVPETPIQVSVDYAYSKVMGDFVAPRVSKTQEEHNELLESVYLGTADFEKDNFKGVEPSMEDEIDSILSDD